MSLLSELQVIFNETPFVRQSEENPIDLGSDFKGVKRVFVYMNGSNYTNLPALVINDRSPLIPFETMPVVLLLNARSGIDIDLLCAAINQVSDLDSENYKISLNINEVTGGTMSGNVVQYSGTMSIVAKEKGEI